ncbi:MAG: hypothetical protein O4807_11705, partial [Trichodesmium sp. St19_bin2]|nr:hypothetical protein [Trichodesmium sp. St19_bin2]
YRWLPKKCSSVLMSFVITTQRAFHNRFNYRWDNIHLTIPTLYPLHYQIFFSILRFWFQLIDN